MTSTERIESLRKLALRPVIDKDVFAYHFYKAYKSSTEAVAENRYAESFFAAFSALPTPIADGELIVGERTGHLSPEQQTEWREIYEPYAHEIVDSFYFGQDSHMAIDYELVLEKGLLGIIDRIDSYLETCDEEKKPFYSCCRTVLRAVIVHSEGYANYAEECANCTSDSDRRAELLEIARICRKVPANPCETFHEAVQATHFITYALSHDPFRFNSNLQFQLGRPDRFLYKYYRSDIEAKRITRERAQLLLDLLGIQINMRVRAGLSSGYMVGGRDRDGRAVANELSEMAMRVIDDIRLVYPSVGLCVCSDTPDSLLELACEILSHGRSHPAIFGDETITKGLRIYGVPEDEACEYIHSTCVEITPIASSNVWVASPYTNMPQKLLEVMDAEYDSFEALLKAYFSHLSEHIKRNFEEQNSMRRVRGERSMNPLLSCVVKDCLERGLDIERGGGRYNWIMPSFVGVPNTVDSLYAIRELVYVDREMTLAEYKSILDRNFEGHEDLRLRVLTKIPKYGNDNDAVDGLFTRIKDFIVDECRKHKAVFSNGALIPSVFCWVMHERFGRETGATPDGRVAGFPLADGSGPCQGREVLGPTASILSSTKWSHSELIGGVAVNMKFSKQSFTSSSFGNMLALIKTFIERGGFELQINVTDKAVLEKARENPDLYRDLVVRIGGYSDYFTNISPEMQAEVILRTEHEI